MKDKINAGIIHGFCLLRSNCFHLGRAEGAPAKLLRTRLGLIDCFAFCVEPGRECRAIGGEHNACALCLWLILQGRVALVAAHSLRAARPEGSPHPNPRSCYQWESNCFAIGPVREQFCRRAPCAPQGRAMVKHLVRRFQKHQNCH